MRRAEVVQKGLFRCWSGPPELKTLKNMGFRAIFTLALKRFWSPTSAVGTWGICRLESGADLAHLFKGHNSNQAQNLTLSLPRSAGKSTFYL